jgi:hypothetical protein
MQKIIGFKTITHNMRDSLFILLEIYNINIHLRICNKKNENKME